VTRIWAKQLGQSWRYRKTSAAKMSEWLTGSHIERQANKKETPAKTLDLPNTYPATCIRLRLAQSARLSRKSLRHFSPAR
jgi:hypothetical protein